MGHWSNVPKTLHTLLQTHEVCHKTALGYTRNQTWIRNKMFTLPGHTQWKWLATWKYKWSTDCSFIVSEMQWLTGWECTVSGWLSYQSTQRNEKIRILRKHVCGLTKRHHQHVALAQDFSKQCLTWTEAEMGCQLTHIEQKTPSGLVFIA